MAHEKRLLIDVFQAYFYRKNADGNRELVFMSENLTSGSISTTQENTDVRNGQGNKLFAILPGSKDVTVALTENVFSFEALRVNTGINKDGESRGVDRGVFKKIFHKAGKDATESYQIPNGTPINATGRDIDVEVYSLEKSPAKIEEIYITVGNQNLSRVTNINELADGKFMLMNRNEELYNPATPEDGCIVVLPATDKEKLRTNDFTILPYVYITEETGTSTLTVKATDFAEGGELWLQTLEKDEKQRPTAYVYFIFENAMPEGSFEISTVSEVQPNDMTVNMRILSNESGELYRIVREEIPQ